MKNKTICLIALTALALQPFAGKAQTDDKTWIAKSNNYTKILLDIDKKYTPEFGSSQGLAFYDTLISVPTIANYYAARDDKRHAVELLIEAKRTETNPTLKQDLDILINHIALDFRGDNFEIAKKVPFINATNLVYEGMQTLLDDQTPVERRQAAVIRLRKYAGLEKGYAPLTSILQERTELQMKKPGVIYPSKQEMDIALSRNASIVTGIEELFKKYKLKIFMRN